MKFFELKLKLIAISLVLLMIFIYFAALMACGIGVDLKPSVIPTAAETAQNDQNTDDQTAADAGAAAADDGANTDADGAEADLPAVSPDGEQGDETDIESDLAPGDSDSSDKAAGNPDGESDGENVDSNITGYDRDETDANAFEPDGGDDDFDLYEDDDQDGVETGVPADLLIIFDFSDGSETEYISRETGSYYYDKPIGDWFTDMLSFWSGLDFSASISSPGDGSVHVDWAKSSTLMSS